MKIKRTENAARNIYFGTFLRIYQLLMIFIMRTIVIYFLSMEYLGLTSLFTTVLQVLNLAELGVGSAMIYTMYKPIVNNDTKTICALMQLFKVYYRIIGLIILIIGLGLLPFIPKLIKGDVPEDVNVYVLYLINLAATVLTYWLYAYKNSLLLAHQRTDINSKVVIVTDTLKYILQIVIIAVFRSYYGFVIVLLVSQLLTNIIVSISVDKMYPQYKAKGILPKEIKQSINQRIKDLFISKLGGVIVNSTDSLVISAFLGLEALAVYQNYFYLITAAISVFLIFHSASVAGIGNSIIVESKEKNFEDFNKFTFLILWLTGFCTCCFLNLFQPFMKIWVGDEFLLDYFAVICFSLYFLIYEFNQLLSIYKDAAGIWHEDRFRTFVTSLSNLVMNLIMVQFMGIYGVILSTVLSIAFVGMPWLFHNLFTILFNKKDLMVYIKKVSFYLLIIIVSCFFSIFICSFIHLSGVVKVIINLCICLIVPNLIYYTAFHKMKEFKQSIILVDQLTHKKIKILSRFI